jgi:hypothetical protein
MPRFKKTPGKGIVNKINLHFDDDPYGYITQKIYQKIENRSNI